MSRNAIQTNFRERERERERERKNAFFDEENETKKKTLKSFYEKQEKNY
jgi:hypothetical protein